MTQLLIRQRLNSKMLAILILAFSQFCTSGFAHAQQAEMQSIEQALKIRVSKAEANVLKQQFVYAARKADVEGMMEITSLITLQTAGEEEIRRIYTEAYIPRFQIFNKDADECEAAEIADPDGTNGWAFICKLTSDQAETMYMQLTVLRENKWAVASVRFANAE
jgi:hypothetical protein